MKLRYYVVDGEGQLRKVSPAAWMACGRGGCKPGRWAAPARPSCAWSASCATITFTLTSSTSCAVPLTDGVCTAESQLTLQIFTMRDCVTSRELVEHHGAGWPADLRRQLAIALDVPLARLCVPLRVGGPLYLAAAMGVRPHQAVPYLR